MLALAILTILNIFDGILTVEILERGGRERNPALAWLMRRIGIVPALIIVKAAALALVYAFLAELGLLVWGFVVVYLAVVVHNWRELGRMPIL